MFSVRLINPLGVADFHHHAGALVEPDVIGGGHVDVVPATTKTSAVDVCSGYDENERRRRVSRLRRERAPSTCVPATTRTSAVQRAPSGGATACSIEPKIDLPASSSI